MPFSGRTRPAKRRLNWERSTQPVNLPPPQPIHTHAPVKIPHLTAPKRSLESNQKREKKTLLLGKENLQSLKPKTVEVSLSRPTAPQPGRNGEIGARHGYHIRGPRSQRTHNLKTDKNNRHF